MALGKTITVSENDIPVIRVTRQQIEGGSWEVTIYNVKERTEKKSRHMSYGEATRAITDLISNEVAKL